MPVVYIPNVGNVSFPDDMPMDNIVSAIKENIIPQFENAAKTKTAESAIRETPSTTNVVIQGASVAKPVQNIADIMGLEQEEPAMSKASDAATIYKNLTAAKKGELPSLTPPTAPKATLSSVLSGLGTTARESIPATVAGLKAGVGEAGAAVAGKLGQDELAAVLQDAAKRAEKRGAQAEFRTDISTPDIEDPTLRGIYGGVQSAIKTAPSLATALVGGTGFGLLAAGTQVAAEAFNKYMNRGADPSEAALGALSEGGVEIVTELVPMGFLVNKFGKTGATEFIAGLLFRELPGEQAATLAQDAIDTAIANPDKTWAEYWNERPAAAYQTLISTLTQAGLTTAVSKSTQYITQKLNEAKTTGAPATETERKKEPFVGEEPTQKTKPEPAGPPQPTTIEELMQTSTPPRPSVFEGNEVDFDAINRQLLEEGSISQEQFDEFAKQKAQKEAEDEDEAINRRLREASREFDEEDGGVPEPTLVTRGKKQYTPLEAAKYDLTAAKRRYTDYAGKVRGALEATGMTIDQIPDTTKAVLDGLKNKITDAQTKYDSLLEDERSAAEFKNKRKSTEEPKVQVPDNDTILKDLQAKKEELLTPAGKPPMPKSAARAKYDEIQSAYDEIEQLKAQNEEISAKPGADVIRLTKLLGPKLYGSLENLPRVTVKELFQNSFDGIKPLLESGAISEGKINVGINEKNRTIEMVDNGTGMAPNILATKFLEIAGTQKETESASGGLGIAKMQFLFGNKNIKVITVRDGKVSTLETTGPDLEKALSNPDVAPKITVEPWDEAVAKNKQLQNLFPDNSGTYVKIGVPETFHNFDTGKDEPIELDNWAHSYPSLHTSPLFRNVDVNFHTLRDKATLFGALTDPSNNYSYSESIPVGKNFPIDEHSPLTTIKFGWGDAVMYVTREPEQYEWNQSRVHVLSNGIYQFTQKIDKGPKYNFYLDIHPKVKAEDPGYPFDLNRQRFSPAVAGDFDKIFNYVKQLYDVSDLQNNTTNYGTVRYLEPSGPTQPETLSPPLPAMEVPTNLLRPGDSMAVINGKLEINGRPVPEITSAEASSFKIDLNTLVIPQDQLRTDAPILNDNLFVKNEGLSFTELMEDSFGPRFYGYMRELGEAFMELRDVVAKEMGYDKYNSYKEVSLDKEVIGISFDIEYRGVSTRVPFWGMYLNPAAVSYGLKKFSVAVSPERAASAMVGTMVHELAHHEVRSHNEEFPAEMQKILAFLNVPETTNFDFAAFNRKVQQLVADNADIQSEMERVFNEGVSNDNLSPIGIRLKEAGAYQTTDGRTPSDLGDLGSTAASYQRISNEPKAGEGAIKSQQRRTDVPKSGKAKPPITYKHMDKLLNNLKQTPVNALKAVNNLIDIMADRAEVGFWSKVLPLLPDWAVRSRLPKQLVKNGDKFELKPLLPQFDVYDRALAAFERTQKELEGEIKRVLDLGKRLNNKTHKALSMLQLEATSKEIDPDTDTKDPYLNQLWAQLQSMPDGQQAIAVYREQRNFYKKIYNKIRNIAAKNIYTALIRKGTTPSDAAVKTKEVLDRDMPLRKGPYFPMSRFGENWIGFKMKNDAGKLEKGFLMFESGFARDRVLKDVEAAIRAEIREELGPNASEKDIEDVIVNEERLQARDGFSNLLNFVYGQENALSKARDVIGDSFEEAIAGLQKRGGVGLSVAEAEKMLTQAKNDATGTIQQLLIQLAPANSLKKLFARRKKIAGAVADSNRSFAVTATKQMNYLAKLMHGGSMEAALIAANENLKYLSPRNQIFAGMIIREFELRMESNLYPTSQNSIIQALSGTAFVYQMTSIASAIRNVMYMTWNGLGVLGSKLGIAETSALMSKYIAGFSRGFYAKDRPDGVMGFGFPSLLYDKNLNPFVREGLERAVAENKLNISQAYDLAEIRRTPSGIPLMSLRGVLDVPRRGVNMLATVLHNSERMGREVLWATALEGRAKQLFKEKNTDGSKRYTAQQIADMAYEFADEYAGERSAGTFGYQRRGRAFKMPLLNLFLKYKSAPIQVVFQQFEALNTLAWHSGRRWIREERQRVIDDPQLGPEAAKKFDRLIQKQRYEQFKYLVFINAIAFLAMGLEGTPFWWLLSRIAGFFLRQNDPNENNPEAVDFDLNLFLENYAADQMNPEIARMLMRGPLAGALNVSLVEQMSLNPPSMFLQGWSETADKSAEDALQKAQNFFLGPVFGGLPTQIARAYDAAKRDTMRGVEMLLPPGIRTPLTTARIKEEGFTTMKGEVVVPANKVTNSDLFITALGFSPEDYRRFQAAKFKLATIAAKIALQKQEIYDDFWLAEQLPAGERKTEAVAKVFTRKNNFNKVYPSEHISDKDMANSLIRRRKQQQSEQAHGGFTSNEKMWPIIEDRTKFGKMER